MSTGNIGLLQLFLKIFSGKTQLMDTTMRLSDLWDGLGRPLIYFLVAYAIAIVAVAVSITATSQIPEPCVESEAMREQVRAVVLDGIDQALRAHIIKVFDIWMKDTSDQPRRALTGTHIGISAYRRSRANALKWDPPICQDQSKP